MKLGVDLRCIPADGSPGAGVAHAARDLWSALVKATPSFGVELVAFVPRGASLFLRGGPVIARNEAISESEIAASQTPRNDRIEIVCLPDASGSALRRALKKYPVNALFVASGAVPFGIFVPTYPWVHDLTIFDHPEWFPQSWFKRLVTTTLFRHGLQKSAHIFSVSEATKKQIVKILGIEAEKITMTGEGTETPSSPLSGGSDLSVLPSPDKGSRRGFGYALIAGTVEPRKNIPFIISLWPEVQKRLGQPVQLMIAGADGWGNVKIEDAPWIIRKKDVSDEEYKNILSQASLVLVPSLDEGFGRVALEAMSSGIPAIVSDRGALPEVVGDGGLVLSLSDRELWIQSISSILSDRTNLKTRKSAGLQRAQSFSWQKTAEIVLSVLLKK